MWNFEFYARHAFHILLQEWAFNSFNRNESRYFDFDLHQQKIQRERRLADVIFLSELKSTSFFHNHMSACVYILLNTRWNLIFQIFVYICPYYFFPLESLLCAGTMCILNSFKIVTHYFVSYYMRRAQCVLYLANDRFLAPRIEICLSL